MVLLLVWLWGLGCVVAQIPEPRIRSIFPAGGEAGTQGIEVSVEGENLDDPVALVFSNSGITGVPVMSAATPLSGKTWALSNRYTVDVAEDVPPGSYELRFKGRFGVSNAVVFAVGDREEIIESGDNHAAKQAMDLDVRSLANGRAEGGRADYFRIGTKAGETVGIRCHAGVIDSPMQPDVVLFDASGRTELARASVSAVRDARVDYVASEDGEILVRIADFVGKGGSDYVYRLFLELEAQLPMKTSKPWDELGFPYVSEERSADDPMLLNPPCVVEGQWDGKGREHYRFHASKGQSDVVEILSERLGYPTDPVIRIEKHGVAEDGSPRITQIGVYDDTEQYGGRARISLGSRDAVALFIADEDADYHVWLSDQFGGSPEPTPYLLRVGEPRPDFELVAVPGNPVAENKQIRPGLSVLRSGGTLGFEVHVLRRDGFAGPIALRCVGLPDGVVAENTQIPEGNAETTLVLRSGPIMERWDGMFGIVGDSEIGEREAQPMRLRWSVDDFDREEVSYGEGEDLALSLVPEESPLLLELKAETHASFETSLGGAIEIPVVLVRKGAFKGNVRIRPMGIPGMNQPPELNLDEKTGEGVLSIPFVNRDNNRLDPGTHSFVLFAEGTIAYEPNAEAKAAAEADKQQAEAREAELAEQLKAAPQDADLVDKVRLAGEEKNLFAERARQAAERSKARDVKVFAYGAPMTVRLAASPVRITGAVVPDAIDAGGEGTIMLSIERAYGFAEELRIEPVLSEASAAVLRIDAVTMAGNETESALKVTVPAEVSAGAYPLQLKAKLKFNGMDLETTHDVVVSVRATARE